MLKARAACNSLLGPLIYRVWVFESPTMLMRAGLAEAAEASNKVGNIKNARRVRCSFSVN